MRDRKIIFETRVGSWLYGTNHAGSDQDFHGVFIPSRKDLLGIENGPTEWDISSKISTSTQNTKDDVDRKFYSLKRFLHLAAEGQPGQLELLFAPKEMIVTQDPIWNEIVSKRHLFICRKSISPFIGFALSQSYKATLKGENLNLIRNIVRWYEEKSKELQGKTIRDVAKNYFYDNRSNPKNIDKLGFTPDIGFKVVTNKFGFTTVEIAGRNYDVGLKLKTFVENLREIEKKFGKRSQAAAENSYDFKSLMHAYRLLGEGKELLNTGNISLPRPREEVQFLMTIRDGTCEDIDHFALLTKQIDVLRQEIEPLSPLPEEADHAKINELCQDILYRSLLEE